MDHILYPENDYQELLEEEQVFSKFNDSIETLNKELDGLKDALSMLWKGPEMNLTNDTCLSVDDMSVGYNDELIWICLGDDADNCPRIVMDWEEFVKFKERISNIFSPKESEDMRKSFLQ